MSEEKRIRDLHKLQQSVWLDNLSRRLLQSGELRRLCDRGVTGITSNPTIFQKAISDSSVYDDAVRRLAAAGRTPIQIIWDLMVEDVTAAADILRPVHERTGGQDGFVSIEVSPEVAHSAEKTVAMVRDLRARCARPNVMVKIPATREGLTAIRQSIAEGANINVTTPIEPLAFGMDIVYGSMQKASYSGLAARAQNVAALNEGKLGSRGWYIAATLDYKMDWGTPGIFGWYGSGDKKSDVEKGQLGRMPSVMNDGFGFRATSFGTAGAFGINSYQTGVVSTTGTGMWGIGIQVADVSFVKDLSHVLRFAYYQGTNNKNVLDVANVRTNGGLRWGADAVYLTNKCSVFEVNFDHRYRIYENLTAALELGYLNLRTDRDAWWGSTPNNLKSNDHAWKAQLGFMFSF